MACGLSHILTAHSGPLRMRSFSFFPLEHTAIEKKTNEIIPKRGRWEGIIDVVSRWVLLIKTKINAKFYDLMS